MHSPENQSNPFAQEPSEHEEAVGSPKVTPEHPIAETKDFVSYMGVVLKKAESGKSQFVPQRGQYVDFINDTEIALPLQKNIAVAFLAGEPMLVDGGTSLGKTTTVRKMAAELGWEVHYANLNGATDVEDLMGRYIPNPHKNKPEDPEYIFADGKVTQGLRKENGKIKVIILDEFNAAAPNILIRLHEVLDALERGGEVILSEDASEAVAVDKEKTKIIALMNPPGKGYFGREPLDPAQLRRWVYNKMPSELPAETFSFATDALFGATSGSRNVDPKMFLHAKEQALSQEQLQEIPGIREVLEKYKEFHKAAKELLKHRSIGGDQPQPFTYDDRMEPRRVRDFVLRFYNGDISETFQNALKYYYVNKLESEVDRLKLGELIRVVECKFKETASKRKGLERESKKKKPKPADEKEEKFAGKKTMLKERMRKLKRELLGEASVFSPEHRQVLDSIFGTGNLDEAEIPDPTELTQAYFDTRYPKKTPEQIKEDWKNGFVCFRPDWWDDPANKSIVQADETWGTAYMRSMQIEAKALFETSAQIFSESIQKPNDTDGSQHYGSEEGTDPTLDPLLPIIHKVFGENATRFNHSHDELVNQLIPKVEEKIREQFKAKGLSVPDFKVMLEPAVVFNRQTMEKHPTNSKTTTWEWSSTILLTQDNKDSGYCLLVGRAGGGGAGYVNNAHRDARIDHRGFRLAVVLEK